MAMHEIIILLPIGKKIALFFKQIFCFNKNIMIFSFAAIHIHKVWPISKYTLNFLLNQRYQEFIISYTIIADVMYYLLLRCIANSFSIEMHCKLFYYRNAWETILYTSINNITNKYIHLL